MYGIFTYIWLIFMVAVTAGKYTTRYMDAMDNDNDQIYFFLWHLWSYNLLFCWVLLIKRQHKRSTVWFHHLFLWGRFHNKNPYPKMLNHFARHFFPLGTTQKTKHRANFPFTNPCLHWNLLCLGVFHLPSSRWVISRTLNEDNSYKYQKKCAYKHPQHGYTTKNAMRSLQLLVEHLRSHHGKKDVFIYVPWWRVEFEHWIN